METIRDLLEYTESRYGNNIAFRTEDRDITYTQFLREVRLLGSALLAKGITSLAIIGRNSYQWILAYYAAVCSGVTVIPLDKGLPAEEIASCLMRSHAEALFCSEELLDEVSRIENIPPLLDITSLPSEGKLYDQVKINPTDAKILLFTSGTTSKSKAVMLSNRNIVSNVEALNRYINFYPSDVNMVFLPLHHTFGSTGLLMMLSSGMTNVFCRGLKYIQKDMIDYKVSVFVGVPLLIENMYNKIIKQAEKQNKLEKLEKAKRINGTLRKYHINLGRFLFKEIYASFGGRLRCIVSGASALNPEVARGFNEMGISLVQGYGLTETSPVISAEPENTRHFGSVGKPMDNVEARIENPDENGIGELVVKGPNVMLGYFENPEETAKVIKNGWFYTGDLASIDSQGFIFLKGRKKNVIVLRNGKNVFPEELEEKINRLPFVVESLVYGEAKNNDPDDLVVSARIVVENTEADIQGEIDALNETLPTYKRIKRISITMEVMEKTTTMKIKRYTVLAN